MSRKNRLFTAEQNANAVRRHLSDKTPVSDLATELLRFLVENTNPALLPQVLAMP